LVFIQTCGFSYQRVRYIPRNDPETQHENSHTWTWLVVSTPLKKYEFISIMTFPIYGKSSNSMVPVTTNQHNQPLLTTIKHHQPSSTIAIEHGHL
jgi:hypothetical protein